MMNCCVVVRLSKRSVSFWYQTEGKRYSPLLVKGENELPLYFYVENNQFDFGAAARERFYQNDPNAFGDYFELIKDPSRHFILHGSPKRAKQLLYYGIEQFLAHFLNTVLYKSDSIESYRGDFPLRFIFAADLDAPERDLVAGMFKEAGYRTVAVWNYNQLLLEYLRSTAVVGAEQAALLLTGLADTLYLELYPNGAGSAVAGMVLPNQGADPRLRILSVMIVGYIHDQHPYLDLDTDREVNALLPFCAGLLTSGRMIVTGEAELISGHKYWFRVNLKRVEDSLQYYSGDLMVATSISDLLLGAAVRPEEVVVLLCSEQISTSYFSDRLLRSYPHVKSVEAAQRDGTMQLIFSKAYAPEGITPPSLPPPLPPKIKLTALPAVKPPLPVFKTPPAERTVGPLPPPLPPAKKKKE